MAANAALAVLALHLAAAQGETTTPPPPPPPSSSDAPVAPADSGPPPAGEAAPGASAAAPPPPPPAAGKPSPFGRFRWGASAQAGALLPSPALIAFGLEGRAGWTFNRFLAAYLSVGTGAGLGFWGGGTGSAFSFSVSSMSQWYVGAMGELNLGDLFFVAVGPGIGRMSTAGISISAGPSGGGQQVEAMGGWTPSVDLRLGFGFGKPNPETGRRTGFTLGLDCRAVFPTQSVFVRQDMSGQTVRVSGTGFGIIPMIMLGVDSR